MEPPHSSYWVKFFKNAGFPEDVATRHALTFSNNRIKPDMLPELDKPSLKEMGISLMGDMIAILRYAKKVVDETTTKKFLVHTENTPSLVKTVAKPIVKKIVSKPVKPLAGLKLKVETPVKTVKSTASAVIKSSVVAKKKPQPAVKSSGLYSDFIESNPKPKAVPLKRKFESDSDDVESDEELKKWVQMEKEKRRKAMNNVECKVIVPKPNTAASSQKILKKALEQKRTVFHRLGDSMVSSTTSIADSSNSNFNPTFKVTGIREEKRNSSVFNRLGTKDNDDDVIFTGHLRNGSSTGTHGILKTRTPLLGTKVIGTTVITTKNVSKKPVGTMRADEEANKRKGVTNRIQQLVRTTKSLNFKESSPKITRKLPVSGKLASERLALSAKSRLGTSKQVSFNNRTAVKHIKKQGVFSRLGV